MNKIAEMKGRDIEKKFSVIAPSIKAIETIAAVTQNQRDILHHYLPGPFTFVLPNADFSVARTSTLGIRVPDCAVTAAIGTAFGEPYITTSANISGTGALYSFEEINAHLLQRLPDALLPDLVLNAGDLPRTDASTVVDLTSPTPSIIRQGSGSFSSHR